jgi:hypothetical protein
MPTANIAPTSETPADPFKGFVGVDEMFVKLHADNFYRPFEENMKKLFEGKTLLNGDSLLSVFRSVYDVGVAAGRKIEQLEQDRKEKRKEAV